MIRARHVPLDELFLEKVNKKYDGLRLYAAFILEASASVICQMIIVHKIGTIII